jgi:hypothetical protein
MCDRLLIGRYPELLMMRIKFASHCHRISAVC